MNEFIQNFVLTSPPAQEPITLAQAKVQCRVDVSDTTEDDFISGLITAAREYVETRVRRTYVSRSYQLRMNRFPYLFPASYYPFYTLERLPNQLWGKIELPKPPLISVDFITYVDNNGDTQTLDPSQYQVDVGGYLPGYITPAYGLTFPSTRYQMDAVIVDYTAGFSDPTTIPRGVCQAIGMCVGHWFRNREAVSEGSFTEVPMAVDALLSSQLWGSYR